MSDTVSPAAGAPRIVIISGPSGSGKTTIVRRLLAECPVTLVKSISATTRAPRPGEVPGDDYYFLSPEEFQRRRAAGEFIECFEVHGKNWYGTPRSELDRAQQLNGWCLLEIDVQGALKVQSQYPQAVMIFLRTSSIDEFERRLRARQTETEEAIQRRVANALKELEFADQYRYQVYNDSLDKAVADITNLLIQEEQRPHA